MGKERACIIYCQLYEVFKLYKQLPMLKMLPAVFFVILSLPGMGQYKTNLPQSVIPSMSLYNIQGDTTNLLSLAKGKITFIDCWFIPCGPCFSEMSLLHNLYNTYRHNDKVAFLTITFSDSSFVRPLLENRNTDNNEVYDYFKTSAHMDRFDLPVFFTKNCSAAMSSFVKDKNGKGFTLKGEGGWGGQRQSQYCPEKILGFSGYPTILIYDQYGKLIYHKTGFFKEKETGQLNTIR